jgi:hypothetical protein
VRSISRGEWFLFATGFMLCAPFAAMIAGLTGPSG